MKYKELKFMDNRFRKMSLNELGMTDFVQLSFAGEWLDDEGHYWPDSWVHVPRNMYDLPLEKVFMELLPSDRWQFPWAEPLRLQGCSIDNPYQLNLLTGDLYNGWYEESPDTWISNLLE